LVKQFPNPAREIVHYNSNKLVKEIIIHNQIGQVVDNILINETNFDLSVSSFNEGVYYVELLFSDNNTMLKKLIVIN